ncbi:MAG: hypothetical protein M1828_000427 [Chrysothrix sp. TS-e1954]|nr:MAG: hypothetical protein M1828_000427 [Chrysothrix sp. TS-e1954]
MGSENATQEAAWGGRQRDLACNIDGPDKLDRSQDGVHTSSKDEQTDHDPPIHLAPLPEPLTKSILSTKDLETVQTHETLKYHLLGPSLTKAGQDTVDQQKVSEIIYNASKGSKFFNNESNKDKTLTVKINNILAKKRQLEKLDLSSERRKADEYIAELEMSRDLSQHIVHIDCDAFYAAVEELDRPELRDVPMAVGKGVLTTCNYHARKFGCRSGMAGFVAMKLCPELICLPLNFEKYTAKAQEVREVLAEYDPRFESASIDEAYLNITAYCEEHERDPESVVEQLRAEVHEKAKITISAGIAANGKLAKICSNRNKPNGQFRIAADRAVIMAFVRDLPTRKINGIGRVFERELDAIGIRTCGDIYAHRALLAKLFGDKAFQFLLSVYLGLGRTSIRPADEYERKSVGTESTFGDLSGTEELQAKLRHIAEELEKDMRRTQFKGRTLCLKIKLYTYEVLTRQTIPPKGIYLADDLYKYSLPMLTKLQKEFDGMTLRLMGLRCTHLVSTKKEDVDFFRMGKVRDSSDATHITANSEVEDGWQAYKEEDFEDAALRERQEEFGEVEALSQEHGNNDHSAPTTPSRRHGREIRPNPIPASQRERPPAEAKSEVDDVWRCPICSRPQTANDRAFNEHIDYCLSKGTIQDAVKEHTTTNETPIALQPLSGNQSSNRKRARPPREASGDNVETKPMKRFFFATTS